MIVADKERLESEKRQMEIKTYERQTENEKLKQDVIQSKILIEGMDSELILLRS